MSLTVVVASGRVLRQTSGSRRSGDHRAEPSVPADTALSAPSGFEAYLGGAAERSRSASIAQKFGDTSDSLLSLA